MYLQTDEWTIYPVRDYNIYSILSFIPFFLKFVIRFLYTNTWNGYVGSDLDGAVISA